MINEKSQIQQTKAPVVLREDRDGITLLTINRPEKLNALNYSVIDLLQEELDSVEIDRGIRAVILTGAGTRAFSAGADITEFRTSILAGVETALHDFVRRGQRLTSTIEAFPKPVVVAVNGMAFGGGFEIVQAAHLAVASATATFAEPELRLGIIPCFGGSQRLARLIGRKRAIELTLGGEPIWAPDALRYGVVNQMVESEALLNTAFALAQNVVKGAPLATKAALTAITRGLNVSIDEGLEIEAAHFSTVVRTKDVREGLDAFVARRAARFVGE